MGLSSFPPPTELVERRSMSLGDPHIYFVPERLMVLCLYCRTRYEGTEVTNCKNCGAPMPATNTTKP